MAINNIPLEKYIQQVMVGSWEIKFPTFYLYLHTEEHDIPIQHIKFIDVVRDFYNNFTDVITVEFIIPKGDYNKYILPRKDKLEFTLCVKREDKEFTDKLRCRRYKGVIIDVGNEDKSVLTSRHNAADIDALNKTNFVYVKAQLVIGELLFFKQTEVYGTYRDTPTGILGKLIANEVSKALGDKMFLYIAPGNSKKHRIVISPVVRLHELPAYLQENYGLFSGLPNIYFTKTSDKHPVCPDCPVVYVYPKAYSLEGPKLRIYNSARSGIDFNDKSFKKVKGGDVEVVTSQVEVAKAGFDYLLQEEVGYYGFDVTKIFNRYVDDTTHINSKDCSDKFKQDIDKLLKVKMLTLENDVLGAKTKEYIGYTSNEYVMAQLLNKKKTTKMTVTLKNFDGLWDRGALEEIIYPGMGITYLYTASEYINDKLVYKIKALQGGIEQIHTSYDVLNKEVTSAVLLDILNPVVVHQEQKKSEEG